MRKRPAWCLRRRPLEDVDCRSVNAECEDEHSSHSKANTRRVIAGHVNVRKSRLGAVNLTRLRPWAICVFARLREPRPKASDPRPESKSAPLARLTRRRLDEVRTISLRLYFRIRNEYGYSFLVKTQTNFVETVNRQGPEGGTLAFVKDQHNPSMIRWRAWVETRIVLVQTVG